MTARPSSPPPTPPDEPGDDAVFVWPPDDDELAVFEIAPADFACEDVLVLAEASAAGPDEAELEAWRRLQEASIEVFSARPGAFELDRDRVRRLVSRQAARRLALLLTAAALVVVVAATWLYRTMRPPVAVEAAYTTTKVPAPAKPSSARPPDITIVATYPTEARPAPAGSSVADAADSTTVADASSELVAAPVDADAIPANSPSETRVAAGEAFELPTPPAPGVAASVVTPEPPEPLGVPGSTGAAPAGVALASRAAEALPVPAAVAITPSAGIRGLLQQYEDAYDRRDVQTAATLWPSLDVRALTRAFASLDRQDLTFDRCDIEASRERGSAVCVGTVRYVPSVGRGVEKQGRITWTFDLTRSGEDWRIVKLTAR